MVVSRRSKALIIAVVGVALAAAGGFASAQGFGTDAASSAALTVQGSAAGFEAVSAARVEAAVSAGGMFSTGGTSGALLADEGTKVDVAMAGDEDTVAVVAQTPAPAAPAPEGVTVSTQPILVNERVWSDGLKTIVECTGDVTRTCQANVYGPNGEFLLGRKISPSGEAVDCSGPCVDASGAPLDAATVTRAQAAVDAGAQTHKVITSAGLPPAPPVVTEAPVETEAEVLRHEGE